MYESFYGLLERPFELTPDPRFVFLTPGHSEALAHLEYGLSGRKGITVLIGEVGTGKTTLLRSALGRIRPDAVAFAQISNPTLTRDEFYRLLAIDWKLTADAGASKAQFLVELEAMARRRHEAGGVTALIVDEAQSMPLALLEEIRLLANVESETTKLLQVLLVGQPELASRLNQPELRQLKQRIALRCVLNAMNLRETAAYIAGRIRMAGGDAAKLFTREAVAEIFERSQGIPRLVNVICDNALVSGFALAMRPVARQVIVQVCHDFDFSTGQPVKRLTAATLEEMPPAAPPVADAVERALAAGSPPVTPAGESSGSGHAERRRFSLFGNFRRSRV